MTPDDAVAIIGCACRLPNAPDPDALWDLLVRGGNAIAEVPAGRWHAAQAERGARYGGFLDQVDQFDAEFFGISPNEAAAMDPQQRLVLELAWEAMEDAAIIPATLQGTGGGVFIGVIADDYGALVARGGAGAIDRHSFTGLNRGVIANRVSFTFGLHGPSLAVDTGQSSSAVAVHLACQSIRHGECELAVAGGVNLNLTDEATLRAERFGALSPDGRCYTFDARANGYVRGEGGAVVVLKPLARALADGDRPYCVILGSAVNSDGNTDSLGVPSREAQAAVVRAACAKAGVDPAGIQYVELHGTGTKVGDPVEAAALGAALGAGRRPGSPLQVGSVKTNIGHLEGAAGIAGLVKAALAIRHRELPPSLNFDTPNPAIPLDRLNLEVRRGAGPWPRPSEPLLAGVSSFGIGGTNCHLVLGPAPGTELEPGEVAEPAVPWPISARSRAALRAQAARLAEFLTAHGDVRLADVGFSLASTRSIFEHRAVAISKTYHGFLRALTAMARGEPSTDVIEGHLDSPAANPDMPVEIGPSTTESGWEDVLRASAREHVRGVTVAWDKVNAELGGRRVPLPTYAFQRRRHWLAERAAPAPVTGPGPRSARDTVLEAVAATLGYGGPRDVDASSTFKDLGFDSLAALELRDRLSATTGRPLPSSLIFDHPTPAALAEFMATAPRQGSSFDSALDAVEAVVAELTGDEERGRVRARLQDLIWRLDGTGPSVANGGADDLLAALESEFGLPPRSG